MLLLALILTFFLKVLHVSGTILYALHLETHLIQHQLYQFSSVAQSCPTLCDPMNRITPGLPVHHHLPEFTQTHVHQVRDAIQPSLPRSSPSPTAPNPSQHQSLFQWVNSSHEVAKVLEFQLQQYHIQSFAYFIHPLLVHTWKRSRDFGFRYNLLLLIRGKKLLLGNCKET